MQTQYLPIYYLTINVRLFTFFRRYQRLSHTTSDKPTPGASISHTNFLHMNIIRPSGSAFLIELSRTQLCVQHRKKILNMSVNTGKHGAVESVKYLLHYAGDKLGDLRAYVEKWLKAVDGNFFSL